MVLNFVEYHGFFLNEQMKWTFKSHKGFFIPVIYNDEIKGLRIHLEEEYRLATTDIWFSSGNEYQGTNAKNHIMIFIPETERRIKVYDKNNIQKKDIIVCSEFLMAYKLFNRDNKITIAIPNRITKKQGQKIIEDIDINTVDVYIDKHTISYDYMPIYSNFLNNIPEDKQKINFIFKYEDLIIKNDINAINSSVA